MKHDPETSARLDPASLDEFSLIEKYFKQQKIVRSDVILGIGDDAAVLTVPQQRLLVVSMDTLVAGVHFLPHTSSFDLGYKALAVNLSDLAAMGAEPAWITLALTMPTATAEWLEKFSQGLAELAALFQVQLIGGDTTRGPLTITIQAHGFVPPHQVLYRHGAKIGDKIYVSGTLGDAGLGLRIAREDSAVLNADHVFALQRLHRPTPRIQLGILLREFATSAIDISDGLLADLNHILQSSHVGAEIAVADIPLSSALKNLMSDDAEMLALTAGDDYELCFTVPAEKESELQTQLKNNNISCSCIGEIQQEKGLRLSGFSGSLSTLGYKHF